MTIINKNVNTIFIVSMYQQNCLCTLLEIMMYWRNFHSLLSWA